MSSLGNALAIALPLLAGTLGGGAPTATSAVKEAASKSKAETFLSAGAKAFLGAQNMRAGDKPFQSAAPQARQNRSVTELTRGTAVGTVTPMAAIDPVQFQMPLYRSVLDDIQRNVRNTQVRDMLDRYGYVQPTKAAGQSEKVRMTEVSV